MKRFHPTLKSIVATTAAVSLLTFAGAGHVLAAAPTVTADIAAGSLSSGVFSYDHDFGTVTLNGTQQTQTATWSILPVDSTSTTANIVDARGTNAGWTLSLQLAQLKDATITGDVTCITNPHDCLAVGSVTISSVPTISPVPGTGTDGTNVSVAAMTPGTTALDTTSGTSVNIATAESGSGAGSFYLSPIGVTLTVPPNTYAHTYTSMAVVTLS